MADENTNCEEVLITHFVLHVGNKAHAKSVTKQLDKSKKNGMPGLVHGIKTLPPKGDGTIDFILPDATTADGRKIKFILPEGGANIVAGDDLKQKIKADQKKLAEKSYKI